MSYSSFFKDLLKALLKKETNENKKETQKVTEVEENDIESNPEPLQLCNDAHDLQRKDTYLPINGDSGRAVLPVFSTTTHASK